MSTIDTHLNWGASYLVNDIYRRFVRPDAPDREYVLVAKLCVLVMMILAVWIAFSLTSIGRAWVFVWAQGAGIGPVLILRWFWWRINAWSEIAALSASVLTALTFEVIAAVQSGADYELFATAPIIGGVSLETHHKALILVPLSILVWVTVTLVTRPVEQSRLVEFYRRVRPGGWWGPVAATAPEVVCDGLSWRRIGVWLAGAAGCYGLIFGLGKIVLGQPGAATLLLAVAALAALVVAGELRRDRA